MIIIKKLSKPCSFTTIYPLLKTETTFLLGDFDLTERRARLISSCYLYCLKNSMNHYGSGHFCSLVIVL